MVAQTNLPNILFCEELKYQRLKAHFKLYAGLAIHNYMCFIQLLCNLDLQSVASVPVDADIWYL